METLVSVVKQSARVLRLSRQYHLRVELVVADPDVVLECPRFAIVESATWVNASDKFLKLAGTSDNAHDCFGGVLGVPQDAKTCGPSSSIGAVFLSATQRGVVAYGSVFQEASVQRPNADVARGFGSSDHRGGQETAGM